MGTMTAERKEMIIKAIKEGRSQSSVALQLGISRQRLNQIIKLLVQNGDLPEDVVGLRNNDLATYRVLRVERLNKILDILAEGHSPETYALIEKATSIKPQSLRVVLNAAVKDGLIQSYPPFPKANRSKLTKEFLDNFFQAIDSGLSIPHAAKAMGVTSVTGYKAFRLFGSEYGKNQSLTYLNASVR